MTIDETSLVLNQARVVVLSRDGCHLCADAEEIVGRVCQALGVAWSRVDIDQHPQLRDRFTHEVPVIFVDGAQHDMWRVDPARLRAQLTS